MDKIYLGTLNKDFDDIGDNNRLYLEKHRFYCKWYWGFGYVSNRFSHQHFDGLFSGKYDIKEIFKDTRITQKEWYTIKELFASAYTLRKSADLFHIGGSHITDNTVITKDISMCRELNILVENLLNEIWDMLTTISKRKVTK